MYLDRDYDDDDDDDDCNEINILVDIHDGQPW